MASNTPLIQITDRTVCINKALDTLNIITPKGGKYTGIGVINDSIFKPLVAGIGIHTLRYYFKSSTDCITYKMYKLL